MRTALDREAARQTHLSGLANTKRLSKRGRPASCPGKEVRALIRENPNRRHFSRPVQVYVMMSGDYLKIGKSINPGARLRSLQRSTGYDIALIGSFRGLDADENALHTLFARQRFIGEWFRRTPLLDRVAEVLCGLRKGQIARTANETKFRSTPEGSFHV